MNPERVEVSDRQCASAEPQLNELLLIMHFYQPFRRMRLLSDPSPDARTFIEIPPGDKFLEGYPDINTKIFYECYEPMLVAENSPYQPFSRGTLSSCYASLRSWMEFAQPNSYKKMQENVDQLGPDAPYRILGDPFLHIIMADETPQNQRMWTKIGRESFKRDLGFAPKGIWLPETAISQQTAQILFEEGYEYTALRDDQLIGAEQTPAAIPVQDKSGEIAPFGVIQFDAGKSGSLSYDDATSINGDHFLWSLNAESEHEGKKKKFIYGSDGELYGHHKPLRNRFAQYILNPSVTHRYGIDQFDVAKNLSKITKPNAILKSPSSWSCDHGVGRWTGGCECGTEDEDDRRNKTEMHRQTKQLEARITQGLNETIPQWRDQFVEVVLETRPSMFFTGDIYADLGSMANRKDFSFLNDQSKRDQFLSWYALEVSKISCRLFFAGKNGLERNLGWNNLHQADLLHRRARGELALDLAA